MKHTPAPWYNATKSGDFQGWVYSEKNGADIAAVYHPEDAALIAAAPELLEALKIVRADGDGWILLSDKAQAAVIAAIAKAERLSEEVKQCADS